MKVLVVSIHSHIMRMDGGDTGLGSFIGDFTGDAMMPAFHQFGDGGVVFDVLVQFGHQRALAIPLMWTDNVYALGLEGVGGRNDRHNSEKSDRRDEARRDGSQTTAQGRFHGIPVHLKLWQPKKSGWVRAIFLLDNAIHRFLLVNFAAQPG